MLLLEQFHTLTLYPQNAAKLKALVLQLAVQGKLTERWRNQNPNVESASQLLKRISEEKSRLVKEKQIKKEDPLLPISEEEIPYELPERWVWCRLGELGIVNPRNYIDDNLEVSFVPMTLISDKYGQSPSYEKKNWREVRSGFTHLAENDVAVAKITPCFENSKACVFKELLNGYGAGTTELHIFRSVISGNLPWFIYLVFKSPIFLKEGKLNMRGAAGQKRVPTDFVKNYLISLPPLEEIEAIVARVEELMGKIEELKKQTVERLELKKKVGAALLQQLTNSINEEMEQNWLFFKENFQTIFDEEDNVKKLRETILQLAVQGKLTQAWRKQHPDIEPASELLKRISEEKARLVNAKKIKKEVPLPAISAKEIPYELPEGWEWCRLGIVLDLISGQHIDSSDYNEIAQGYPYLTGPSDFGEIHPNFTKWTEKPKVFANKDDILITVKGSGVGKLNILHKDQVAISRQLMAIRPFSIPNNYIFLFLKSEYESFQRQKVGIAIPGIGREDILYKYIPLPPYEEQKAIISKVEGLVHLCGELEKQVSQSKQGAEQLMQAALYQTLQIKEEVEA